jgi:hypothetical protein
MAVADGELLWPNHHDHIGPSHTVRDYHDQASGSRSIGILIAFVELGMSADPPHKCNLST